MAVFALCPIFFWDSNIVAALWHETHTLLHLRAWLGHITVIAPGCVHFTDSISCRPIFPYQRNVCQLRCTDAAAEDNSTFPRCIASDLAILHDAGIKLVAETLCFFPDCGIVGTTAGGKDFLYVFDSKDFWIERFNDAHILHQKVAVRVVFQPCMSVGIAEWFAGWTADNNIGSLYRIVQWKAFCRERFMNISVYDVHTDVLPVGLAGTGIVVNGLLDAEPLVLEKRPVEDAST